MGKADKWDPKHPENEQYAGQGQVEEWAKRNPKQAAAADKRYGSYRWAGERALKPIRDKLPAYEKYDVGAAFSKQPVNHTAMKYHAEKD